MITPIYQLISSTIPPLDPGSKQPKPRALFFLPFFATSPSFGQPPPPAGVAYGLYLGRAESIQFNKQTNKQNKEELKK